MAQSRSGTIRRAIGPARARLVGHANVATEQLGVLVKDLGIDACEKLVDDIEELSAKINSSITTLRERDQQWQALIQTLSDDDLAAEEEIYNNIALDARDGYLTTVELSKELLCGLERKLKEANRRIERASDAGGVAPAGGAPDGQVRHKSIAKLPKLTLPTFSGDCLEWQNFWSIFKANVHDQTLTNAEKFAYLRAQLAGTALHVIDGIQVNDTNYDSALAILTERFQKSAPQLVSTLYSQLKRLSPATATVSSLMSTYDSLEKIFRQLENAGESVDANHSLTLDVLSKYPAAVVSRLMDREKVGPQSSLKEVRIAVGDYVKKSEDIAEMLEDLHPFGGVASHGGKQPRHDKQSRFDRDDPQPRPLQQTSAFTTVAPPRNIQSTKPTPQSPCYFCGGKHFNARCDKFQTAGQRIAQLRVLNRCTRCLWNDHPDASCRNLIRCFFCNTVGQHATPVCPKQFPTQAASNAPAGASTVTTGPTGVQAMLNVGEQAVLMTASTTATNPGSGHAVSVRLLFDSGSHRSYITAECATNLQLKTLKEEAIHVSVFGTKRTLSVASHQVSIGIMQRDGSIRNMNAHTTPIITDCPILPKHLPPEDMQTLHAMRLTLADDVGAGNGSIDILVGSDYFWEFMNGACISTPSGLYLIPSTVGLLVAGRYQDDSEADTTTRPTLLCLMETYGRSDNLSGLLATESAAVTSSPDVDEFWALERIGIMDDPIVKDDDKALAQFNDTVYYDDGRYHVRWPKKDNYSTLPVNFELAYGRFSSLSKRLFETNPEIRQKYQEIIDDQLSKNVIERVPDDEINYHNNRRHVHYLPHHPVVKPSSETTNVRIVYDASSKTRKGNPSLNECLYRGPVMLPELCGILIRFRLGTIGVVADVEKAFLQIVLHPEDRDVTRFLFFADPSVPVSVKNIAHFRFCRVTFGVVSSPFLLGAVTQYHLQRVGNWVSDIIQPNMYVDNVICSVNSVDAAMPFYVKAKSIFRSAGMNLQQWCSNAAELMDAIPEEDTVKQRDNKVLGMQWDSADDTLRLKDNIGDHLSAKCSTKRNILTTIASVYDPLGLFQPVLLPAKLFLHKLWKDGKGWDDDIGEHLRGEWRNVMADICPVFGHRIQRHPLNIPSENAVIEVVAFCDASQMAYATAVYIRVKDGATGRWGSALVYSKSRLTPKHKAGEVVSMPRLELLGMTIGARAANFVRKALMLQALPRIYVFTDSICVLHWLRTTKPLSVFVDNRVKEIKSVKNAEFRHVGTKDNPADYSTRGKTAAELSQSTLWWHGPLWLSEPRDGWPGQPSEVTPEEALSHASMEYKKTPVAAQLCLAGEGLGKPNSFPLSIDPSGYSTFRKLQRVTVRCMKFVKLMVWDRLAEDYKANVSPEVANFFRNTNSTGSITREELFDAKLLWIRHVQAVNYDDLIRAVVDNSPHTLIKQLGVSLDDVGILRCFGRFEHADLASDAIKPTLLSRNDQVTDLIIRDVHSRQFHSGVAHTLGQLRRQYWIPHGRNAVRKVISKCVMCRKHKGAPFALPRMPPWPRERVARSSPFRYTGLDYFGPVSVKVGDEVKKSWVCLFTCLAVRAIHLEWVADCTAKEFLQCVVRFVSRRGTPDQIISDNAPQFRVVKSTLDKMWTQVMADDSVQTYVADKGIEWKFTTQLAPWQGGFYERLVGVVKSSFKAAVGRRMLQFGEFITLCAEVEAVANCRPITYVHSDLNSGPALRPIDFLTDLPVGMPVTNNNLRLDGLGDAGKNLLRFWKLKQGKLDCMWRFWYDQYLLSLRERGQSAHKSRKGEVKSSPAVDEVVLVKDSDAPRGTWKLAKVVRLIDSRDGLIRSAEVLLPNRVIIRRAVNHLYPLEIGTVKESTDDTETRIGLQPDDPDNQLDNANNITETPRDGDEDFMGFIEQDVDDAARRTEFLRGQRNDVWRNIDGGLTAVACTLSF